MICVCGHFDDEHDSRRRCEGMIRLPAGGLGLCPCVYFEEGPDDEENTDAR